MNLPTAQPAPPLVDSTPALPRPWQGLLWLQALVLLLPTTLLWTLGVLWCGLASVAGLMAEQGFQGGWVFPVLLALLVPAGAGLFSLWWLVWHSRRRLLGVWPRRVRVGLGCGAALGVPMVLAAAWQLLAAAAGGGVWPQDLAEWPLRLLMGGGAVVLWLTMLVLRWRLAGLRPSA